MSEMSHVWIWTFLSFSQGLSGLHEKKPEGSSARSGHERVCSLHFCKRLSERDETEKKVLEN